MSEQEIEIECKSCGGTGLYKGMAERDECAVVCSTCKGTGMTIFKYKQFTGLVERSDVKRVFEGTFGYVHTDKDVENSKGEILEFSKYGCSYKEWLNGEKPKPMEQLYCPYIYDNQGIGNEPFLRCESGHNGWGGRISECEFFDDKKKCWEMWNNGEAYKYKESE